MTKKLIYYTPNRILLREDNGLESVLNGQLNDWNTSIGLSQYTTTADITTNLQITSIMNGGTNPVIAGIIRDKTPSGGYNSILQASGTTTLSQCQFVYDSASFDNTKDYRLSIMFNRKENGGGLDNIYLGFYNYLNGTRQNAKKIDSSDTISEAWNFYFYSTGSMSSYFTDNTWYLIVGYLRNSSVTTYDANYKGVVYDMDGNEVDSSPYNYVSSGNTNAVRGRFLGPYRSSDIINWYQFRIDEINGNEPSIEDLLSSSGYTFKNYLLCKDEIPLLYLDILIVAGGGGGGAASSTGGSDNRAGGGGGGGLIYVSDLTWTGTTATITVGSGGAVATNGANSSWNDSYDTLTANGGGCGGSSNADNAGSGGCGGGCGGTPDDTPLIYSPLVSPGTGNQGYNGGNRDELNYFAGAGGGGMGAAGVSVSNNTNGSPGGDGLEYDISGTATYYSGGGGGRGQNVASSNGLGGGNGSYGGGGLALNTGGNGIVIIRYESSTQLATGGTVTTSGGYYIHTFTSNGTFEKS